MSTGTIANRTFRTFSKWLKGLYIDPISLADLRKIPDLSFKAEKQEIKSVKGVTDENFRMCVRTDTKTSLGIVGADYGLVQFELLYKMLSTLSEYIDLKINVAHSYDNGRRFLIGVKLDEGIEIGKTRVDYQLYFGGSFNGSKKHIFIPMSEVAFCMNQFHAGKEHSLFGKHTSGLESRIVFTHENYLGIVKGIAKQKAQFLAMQEIEMTEKTLVKMIVKTFGEKPTEGKGMARWENRTNNILDIFHSESCRGQYGDTVFSGFNAITQNINHESPMKENATDETGEKVRLNEREISLARFESNVYGNSAKRKEAAFEYALTLV